MSEDFVPGEDNLSAWRATNQPLLPAKLDRSACVWADMFPAHPVAERSIDLGHAALARTLATCDTLILDGYGGVFWEHVRQAMQAAFDELGIRTHWQGIDAALKPEAEIEELVMPFLGGDDPLFGTRFTGTLRDFFDADELGRLAPDPNAELNILYGCGAALAGWKGALVYVDLPKNEIQFRSRAGRVTNLGRTQADPPKPMYKRFYFVDWPALNAHKQALLPHIDWVVDEQRPYAPTFMAGVVFREALDHLARNWIRVRPWFEPGPWGGQWIKRVIPDLPQDAPNYAWSFELIVPENGIVFSDGRYCLETSFDFVMFHDAKAVVGAQAARFGTEFPVRFDFLDTMDGGNLSLQCHPRLEYIRKHFGESITQDETYYILDCEDDARVYLGFQEGVDPAAFRGELERSQREGTEVDVEAFVNTQPAHKHDLFLIPNGTIHCSGRNSMVLEISNTPYIFTFKMYDWMRRDLEGNLRPLNIERAFDNLYFDRQGERIGREFVSHPSVIETGSDWRVVHLPTHAEHFYDVHRLEFATTIDVTTEDSFHVLMLVEGESVLLETRHGDTQRFRYAETFVVPAAAEGYRLINESGGEAWVVKCFLKPA